MVVETEGGEGLRLGEGGSGEGAGMLVGHQVQGAEGG